MYLFPPITGVWSTTTEIQAYLDPLRKVARLALTRCTSLSLPLPLSAFASLSLSPAYAPAIIWLSFHRKGDLSIAVREAVSDYVELRGLNGLCPDVTKWSPPPGPAAFLDAGLPKTGGAGSLPRGLAAVTPGRRALGEDRGEPQEGQKGKGSPSIDNGCGEYNDGKRRPYSRLQPGARRKRSSCDSIISTSSIPSPTWEAKGPEGFTSQVRRSGVMCCVLRAMMCTNNCVV